MASDQQLALSRSHHRLPPSATHVSKHSRQVVPAFLQKLYEMVNDPKNASLIRWSDDGDSFFVLDHERFANEVLGRWFKHKNFSSFVRQLNMYGFHKIPHLQQGVLRSETETEFWNFSHANFHRGQPDLLCLIQRKKQSSQQQMQIQQHADDVTAAAAVAAALVSDVNGNTVVGLGGTGAGVNGPAGPSAPNVAASVLGASGVGPTGLTVLSNAQILDIHSIVQGIAAIKRHQTTISAELSELKRSNELLWQDALMAREKHQKQEDTINRIVKFLAGVFGKQDAPGSGGVGNGGHHAGGHHHGRSDGNPGSNVSVQRRGGAGGNPHQRGTGQRVGGVVTRRRARLMIEDGRKQTGPIPPTSAALPDESDEDAMMSDSTVVMNQPVPVVGGGRDNPSLGMTLSDYRSTSPTLSQGILELGDDNATTCSLSALDLNDTPHGAAHVAHDSMDYPTIESNIETPKSVNTPLPVSSAETAANPHVCTALNAERALARTPPIFHGSHSQQSNSAHGHSASAGPGDNATFSFDPRNLMINLTPAQIQQLLTTLATQTPSGSMDHHYEGGFLTSADGDEKARREDTHHAIQQSPTPPFDISSYLVPSPQLANLPLANGANAASNSNATSAASSSTPATPPTLSSFSTPRAGADGGAYVPVPDGLISFDGTDVNGASSESNSAARSGATATATATSTTAMAGAVDAPGEPYTGDLSVMRGQSPFILPWMYQGYNGFPASNPNAGATTGGGYANGNSMQGFAGFSFPLFGAGGEWSGPGSGGTGGTEEAGEGSYDGLFTPQNATPHIGYTATAGAPAAAASSSTTTHNNMTNSSGQASNRTLGANDGNNDGTVSASAGSHDANLATLSSSWHATEDIDRDVNALNTTIHNLIQTFGLDPTLMDADVEGGGEGGNAGPGAGATGGGDGIGTGTGTGNGNGNGFDLEHFLGAWNLPGPEGASGGTGAAGPATTGIASVPPSDAATTASSSPPSVGSVAGEGPDGPDADGHGVDGVLENGEDGVGARAAGLGFVPGRAPIQSRPTSSSGSGSATATVMMMVVDPAGARPINKKARTSLTASAPTSAGVPMATVEVGGGKRRTAIVGANAGGGEGEGDGMVGGVADAGQETGGAVGRGGSQVQTRSAFKSTPGTKGKKRRN